uniref:Uncharacterized protein n=1 Tax=Lactuca sativa TaxID=4236 RepID=A0A9R1WG79_LACSA|nr:hypothetical protein LSAT_V11C200094590 [Lactuca sativa]
MGPIQTYLHLTSSTPTVRRTNSSFYNGKMTISSARSSFKGGSRKRKKRVEGGNYDFFFKWVDGELDQEMEMSHTKQIKPLLEVIIGLLVLILMMVAIVKVLRNLFPKENMIKFYQSIYEETGVTLVTLSLPKSIQGDLGLLLLHNNQVLPLVGLIHEVGL